MDIAKSESNDNTIQNMLFKSLPEEHKSVIQLFYDKTVSIQLKNKINMCASKNTLNYFPASSY